MANLLYKNIGTNYKGILNLDATTINTPLDTTLRAVTDGMGNSSALSLSTTQASVIAARNYNTFYVGGSAAAAIKIGNSGLATDAGMIVGINGNTGSEFGIAFGQQFYDSTSIFRFNSSTLDIKLGQGVITSNGKVTIMGAGGNILSLRDSSNVEKASIDNAGVIYVGNNATTNYGKIYETGGHLVLWANGGSGKLLILSNLNTTYTQNNNWSSSGSGAHSFTVNNYSGVGSFAAFTFSTGLAISSVGSGNPHVSEYLYTINNTAAQTGTATGIFLNATETALNGMTHNLMDLQVGGVSKFKVDRLGNVSAGNYTTTGALFSYGVNEFYGSLIVSGNIRTNAFMQFSGTTNAFPMIKRNGAAIDFRLADDSGYCAISASDITMVGNLIRTSRGRINFYGTDGEITLTNSTETSFGLLKFGGLTSAFPAIKRNGAAIDFRLADDSAHTSIGVKDINIYGAGAGIYSNNNDMLISSSYVRVISSSGWHIGDGSYPPASAILELKSTTKGFLMPRMNTGEINAIATPANGLMVYNTDINTPCFYDGGALLWKKVSHSNM